MDDKMKRMKELIEIINNASKLYYQYSTSIMTDFEYDKLYDELVMLEKETNTVLENSPTIHVETEILSTLEKVEHPAPMLSLSKTKKVSELVEFIGDKKGLLSWKLDGLTIVLTYEKGKLVRGVTRGNGIIGEVITENVKRFKNIPLTIPYKGNLVVRGEAVIKYSDFNKMNDSINDDEDQYKNPRNLCSGSVRQLDSNITAERNVNYIIFALITPNKEISNSKKEQYEWLKSLGFEVVEFVEVDKDNMENAVLDFKQRVSNYDIPSDGLVLTYDDYEYGSSLGSTAKYPKHSIAFKWQDETKETTLREIFWNASRTGLINPVAVFDSVSLEGTTVSRASLHNISIIEGLKLAIGDKINVYKANMIIPQVASSITKGNKIDYPDFCPICNHNTIIKVMNDIKYLYCPNPNCRAKLIKKLELFTSRNALNIEGISEAILARLIDEEIVLKYIDIFHLSDFKDKIISFEGFGEKSYNNMINSIDKSRNVKLANFIYSLGIPEIGLSRAKLICGSFNNDINKLVNVSLEELSEIDGIGEVLASEWRKYFDKENNVSEFNELLDELNVDCSISENNVLQGNVFVITGSLNHFENRDKMIEFIEKNGGSVVSSISKNVNYLINNDLQSTSSKNLKAKELNIPIISEAEFLERLN